MSDQGANPPTCKPSSDGIEMIIEPDAKDLGGFSVRRVLPSPKRRMVGPFIFFDHMGPAEFPPGEGIQVRPHPHIGLSTVTYLFEGEIVHRDSLGFEQPIRTGAVNLMTAGRGIVHSERSGDDLQTTSRLHGIQTWMALPLDDEECAPEFTHYPADTIPGFDHGDASIRVIMGSVFGYQSPVKEHVPTLYLECRLPAGAVFELPRDYEELGVYVVSGEVRIDDRGIAAGLMAVACDGSALRLEAARDSLLMIIGGAHLGERHIWWNFVSSSKQRIEQAKDDWREDRFDKVEGDTEFIPLP